MSPQMLMGLLFVLGSLLLRPATVCAEVENHSGKELAPKELNKLWDILMDDDATKAFQQGLSVLVCHPNQAVVLLAEKLSPVDAPDAERIELLVVDLDSSQYQVRQKATEELERLRELAEPALWKALDGKPSLEMRR